ncbi:hypothetical protein Celal_3877 [Cellulophaga algicola DSM 14237]|uniref:Transmembrane protein n=1 Tax=Cellulophaga algicola (strain DSM 14237 / IC166 / ACAM 630) TaxID=688270 RepID=E6XC69_CELAD|nr:hypothetical protein [Cellulophaga algicola]ADV51122.1 hypothetical protein Celal_3877 [Cellulophaga algicola DSM 14237]
MKDKIFKFESLASFSFYYLAVIPLVILIYLIFLIIYCILPTVLVVGILGSMGILAIFGYLYEKLCLKDVTINITESDRIIIDFDKGGTFDFKMDQLQAFYSYDIQSNLRNDVRIFLIFEFENEKVRLFEIAKGHDFEVATLKTIISLLKQRYEFRVTKKSKKYFNFIYKEWEIYKYEKIEAKTV